MSFSWFLNVVVEYDSHIKPQTVVQEALSYININRKEVVKLYNSETAMRLEICNKDKWSEIEKNALLLRTFMYKKYIEYIRLFDISHGTSFNRETVRMEDVCYEGLHAMGNMHFGKTVPESTNNNAATCPICYEKREHQILLNCGHFFVAVVVNKCYAELPVQFVLKIFNTLNESFLQFNVLHLIQF